MFLKEGYSSFPLFFNKEKIKKLRSAVARSRNFKKIFVSKKYFEENQEYKGWNKPLLFKCFNCNKLGTILIGLSCKFNNSISFKFSIKFISENLL
jgi:hypothetical protein